jgi:hypothetical protein
MSARPRRPAGRFLAPNGRTRNKPLREVPSLGAHEEDVRREAELVASHTDPRDEPEGVGPAILTSYAEVSRRLLTQHVINEVAEAQERRPESTPQNRLDTVRQRAKHAHVDMSHPIHLVQRAIDKARLREQPVNPSAVTRLEGLEALLDGVSIKRLAA